MADLFRRPLALLAHQLFEQVSVFMITAVVDSVGVKEKNVSWSDQLDVRDVGRVCLALSEYGGKIQTTIGVIFGNLQAQRRKIRHPVGTHLCEALTLNGKNERRRMSEIHKPKVDGGRDFAIKHGCDLACVVLTPSKRIAGCDRLSHPQIESFKQLWSCSSPVVEFGKHEGMECIVYRRCNFRRNDSVALRVHQKNPRHAIECL